MTERQKQRWSFIAFPLAGFLSALLPVCLDLQFLKLSSACRRLFSGAVVGGFLGSIGRAAGGLVYQIRLYFPSMKFYGSDSDVSLVIIWQTGMAFILCYFLWVERGRAGERSFGMRQENISL